MQEVVRKKLGAIGADHWKLITRNVDICRAQFPAEPGQESTALQSRKRETKFDLQAYRETPQSGNRSFQQYSFDSESIEKPFDPDEGDEMPWFPLEITSPPISQASLSSFSKQDLHEWVLPLQEILSRSCEDEDFILQSEFLRLEREEKIYEDSFGRELVDLTWRTTLDLLILPRRASESQPMNVDFFLSEYSPADLTAMVKERGRDVVLFAASKPWNGQKPQALYLRGHLIGELMSMLVRRLTGLSLYAGLSDEKLGQPLFGREATGDLITLQALGALYNSPFTNFFDEQGLTFSRHTLVESGIVKSFLTSQETAYYLGLPITGLNPNFSLAPGTLTRSQMSVEPALEVVRWRTFDLNESTGRWIGVAEEAFWYDEKTRTPLVGVRLSGTLQELLTQARFSQEIGSWENYTGPEFLQVPLSFLQGVL